ncbi:uncharacterized protein [Procambarus clarkii]|uniref:uncharacterized protein isoform X2 n=2 Tax=Procambarus clarkii TaxID=6728 RepID=UPI001E6703A3|nr:uncharacterized protein LOC123746027 isoform X1 [Procambarus clarkii]
MYSLMPRIPEYPGGYFICQGSIIMLLIQWARMVQLACGCLNIRLHVQETADTLVTGIPNLTLEESQHPFFFKGAWLVTLSLGGIAEGQKFLVRSSRVGGWTVRECLNCHQMTYATQGTSGAVVASTSMINDASKILMLQRCEGYSPVFCMVLPTSIDNRPLPPLSPTDFSNERSPQTEEALGTIQQQVTRFLKKAESQVETNIRAYTDQQQTALHALQTRARRDRQTVMRLLANIQRTIESQMEDDPLATFEMDEASGCMRRMDSFNPMERETIEKELDDEVEDDITLAADEPDHMLPPLVSVQSRTSQPVSVNPVQGITGGMRNMRLSSSVAVPKVKPQGNVRVAQSLDVEGLFEMEGMMEAHIMAPQDNFPSDDDDTDDSNHDEGIHIPGGQVAGRDLAQSVPVSVPMWPNSRPKIPQEPQCIERPSDTDQMAASIRALARSVHSTSVDLFGDLPRPRQPF